MSQSFRVFTEGKDLRQLETDIKHKENVMQ